METSTIISIVAVSIAVLSFFLSLVKVKKPHDSFMADRAKKLVVKGEWTMSDERQFFENLYSQRLNLYIIVFSVVVTGVLAAKAKEDKIIVFSIGLYLVMIAGISLYRACHKLLLILQLLHNSEDHPVKEVGLLARERPWPLSFAINHLTGIWMPLLSFLVLVAWFIMYLFMG